MSGRDNSHEPRSRTISTSRSGSSSVKKPDEYRLGDDLNQFIPRRKVYLPNFPVQHATLLDELEAARSRRIESLLKCVSASKEAAAARAKITLALGKLKHDATYASNFRPSAEKNQLSGDRSAGGTPSPTGQSDSRKSRLEGMDVSALPAGFGKRRSSAAGALANKKSKTPPETAPEIEARNNSNLPSPS